MLKKNRGFCFVLKNNFEPSPDLSGRSMLIFYFILDKIYN